jgi:hypothetical protein
MRPVKRERGGGGKDVNINIGKVVELTRIDCATYNPAQWVPCSVIKPVVETVKSFCSQKFCGPEIEVPTQKEFLMGII